MNTTDLYVEILIIGFQVFTWVSLIVAILFGYDWIPFSALKDWTAILVLFVIGASYTLGTIFDNLFFSLFENRKIAVRTIKKIVEEEITRKARRNWLLAVEQESQSPLRDKKYREARKYWNNRSRHWKETIKKAFEPDYFNEDLFMHVVEGLRRDKDDDTNKEWKEALREELPGLRGPSWDQITSRDPRQVRLYILSQNEELGKELQKFLDKAGLARGSSLNLVIIGALGLILYLVKFGFTLNVFLFGILMTVGFSILAYNTWQKGALVYYFTLWDLLKLTEREREEEERRSHEKPYIKI